MKEKLQALVNKYTENPILYHHNNIILVKFGLISACAAFFYNSIVILVQQALSIPFNFTLTWIILTPLFLLFFSIFFSKVVEYFGAPKGKRKFSLKNVSFTLFGGVFGLTLSTILISTRYHLNLLAVFDSITLFWPLFAIFARFGCLNYGCCHGKPINDDNKFYVIYNNENSKAVRLGFLKGVKIYPTQIYEMLTNFLIQIIILILLWTVDIHGIISGTYCVLYGIARYVLQQYRQESKIQETFFHFFSYQRGISLEFFVLGAWTIYMAIISKNLMSFEISLINWNEYFKLFPFLFLACLEVALVYGFHYKKVGQWFEIKSEKHRVRS